MTTVATVSSPARVQAGAYDRVFYSGMAIAMAMTVLVGFAPTYYLRGYFGTPVTVSGASSLTPLTQLHGLLFTGWVVLFLVQTALVSARRVAVHRRLGIAGVVLAAGMVVVGLSTAFAAAARGAAPPGIDPLVFLVVPFFDIVLFTGFVVTAVRRRRDKEAHKRLMLMAYVSIIVAAVARIPGLLAYGPLAFFALTFVFVIIGMAYDFASRGRVHPVYIWGGAIFAVSVPLRLAISGTAAWQAFARALISLFVVPVQAATLPAVDPVEVLIIGDVQVHSRRADPTTAFQRMRDTLKKADLVYANLEGLLVTSAGPKIDIPDKPEWTHPGPDGVKALKASNIMVVGVANNVASGRDNILRSLRVLDANGISHTGAGKDIDAAHTPAIVQRKGVKIGFLQYTARWYQDKDMIATPREAGVAKITSIDGLTIDPVDLERVRADIKKLRPQVDIVVVSHHNRDGSTAVQFGAIKGTAASRDRSRTEDYQRQFAHVALDTGADLVFGHGTHTVQGVEIYKGKPILYAIGHSNFDQPGYEKSTDGLVVRVVIEQKQIARVSFMPVTRDANNDVYVIDPSEGEGARVVQMVKDRSSHLPPLALEGQEVVLLNKARATTSRR